MNALAIKRDGCEFGVLPLYALAEKSVPTSSYPEQHCTNLVSHLPNCARLLAVGAAWQPEWVAMHTFYIPMVLQATRWTLNSVGNMVNSKVHCYAHCCRTCTYVKRCAPSFHECSIAAAERCLKYRWKIESVYWWQATSRFEIPYSVVIGI